MAGTPSITKEDFKCSRTQGFLTWNHLPAALVFPAVEEAPIKIDRKPSPAKGLLRQGFLGSRNASPSSLEVKQSQLTWTAKEDSFTSSQKMGPPITESQASHTVSKFAHKRLFF